MHSHLPSSLLCALVLLLSCSSVTRADDQAPTSTEAPALVLIQGMQNYRESYISQLMAPFRAAAADRPGLTAQDIQLAKEVSSASARAQALTSFFAADLDGDGRVTLDEFQISQRRPWLGTVRARVEDAALKQFQQMDSDGDGIVTFDEARVAAGQKADDQLGRRTGGDRLEQLLLLDPNKDGLLTADELEVLGRQAFAYYDRDGDGTLSDDERQNLSRDISLNQRMASLREQFLRCIPQRPEGDQEFYFVDAYGAQALSSASLANQSTLTETAEINIESGGKPLFVVALGRRQIIWRLTGDVGRVKRFVAVSSTPAAGVTGLPKDVVNVVPNAQCIGRVSIDAASTRISAQALEQTIGSPLRGVAYQPFSKAKLPSDFIPPAQIIDLPLATNGATTIETEVPAAPNGIDALTNASFRRYHPGGLVEIDPAQVVTNAPVAAYDIPPMEAGLIKLLQDGSITAIGPRAYRIEKPIARIPAGLTGPQAVRFVMAPGVPAPQNNPPSAPGMPLSRIYEPNKF